MAEYDQRLLDYDSANMEERKTMLLGWFSDREMRKLFKAIAENRVIRTLLEFRSLGAIPFEDYQVLEGKGLIECRHTFHTYVPAARGYEFPDVRLTLRGEKMKIRGAHNHESLKLTYLPFQAYRVRHTGHGIVASREVLEQWIDDGEEEFLELLADPKSGDPLELSVSENLDLFVEICDPIDRPRMIKESSETEVETPFTESKMIHSALGRHAFLSREALERQARKTS